MNPCSIAMWVSKITLCVSELHHQSGASCVLFANCLCAGCKGGPDAALIAFYFTCKLVDMTSTLPG